MMEQIIYGGKKYEVKPVTIQMWSNIMKFKDMLSEEELYYKMISEMLGLTKEQLYEASASEVLKAGEILNNILNSDSNKLLPTLEHNGKKYRLVDMNNISFGQFVDIDSFLSKDENYRIANLSELAAYLYTEEGKTYGSTDFKKQTEEFKTLEIKYVEGAVFFLLHFGKALQLLSQISSKRKVLWWMMRLRITLTLIGVGIRQSISSQKTMFARLIMLLLSPLLVVSTTSRFIMTLIKKKKKN